jgi:hypothetical protein
MPVVDIGLVKLLSKVDDYHKHYNQNTNHLQKPITADYLKTRIIIYILFYFTQFVVAINIRQCFIYENWQISLPVTRDVSI